MSKGHGVKLRDDQKSEINATLDYSQELSPEVCSRNLASPDPFEL